MCIHVEYRVIDLQIEFSVIFCRIKSEECTCIDVVFSKSCVSFASFIVVCNELSNSTCVCMSLLSSLCILTVSNARV